MLYSAPDVSSTESDLEMWTSILRSHSLAHVEIDNVAGKPSGRRSKEKRERRMNEVDPVEATSNRLEETSCM